MALLQAAAAMLDEGGVAAVSLREAARRVGVTPAATYRHFADKEALLASLAAQGFDAFAKTMAEAAQNAAEPFAEMGLAYVRFAVAYPGMFRLMFGPTMADRSRSPELQAAVARATHMFDQGVKTDTSGNDAGLVALRAWATVHGLATLVLDGMLPGYDPEDLARALTKMPPHKR